MMEQQASFSNSLSVCALRKTMTTGRHVCPCFITSAPIVVPNIEKCCASHPGAIGMLDLDTGR
jgi:hypothetical protein